MGLDGWVCCTCWKEGKAAPPPPDVPAEYLELDPEDGGLYLALPGDSNDPAWLDTLIRFDRWRESACEHHGMDYHHERMGRYGVTSTIELVAEQFGAQQFPHLIELLPSIDVHRATPADLARLVLPEVERLIEVDPEGHAYNALGRLKNLLQAAVKTGNPVNWS